MRKRRFIAPGAQKNGAKDLHSGHFSFVGHDEDIGWPPHDWQAPSTAKLWQYNLHYFEWLWALDYADVRAAALNWIDQHSLDKGHVGWEPYPTSLRLMNWCAVCFGKFREELEEDGEFARRIWTSIYLQAEWLQAHLETHLLGNHLFENGAALAVAGSCFSAPDARRWQDTGVAILNEEIQEQILPDGMHFERSPMYHVRMTYLLDLLQRTGAKELQDLAETPLLNMRKALRHLCHADGEIALFNDSAFSIYNSPVSLFGENSAAEAGPWSLPDAGYYGYRDAEGNYVVCDAGAIGPDYIPGHAHGDMFSFELSLQGHRVVVDSGVYDYVPGEMRAYCRSTAAHNTVSIDNQDQSEFWGAFRVARRAHPREIEWQPDPDGFRLAGWHDGYERLPSAPVHRRELTWKRGDGLHVRDQIRAGQGVSAVSRLHLHPHCRVKSLDSHEVLIEFAEGTFRIVFEGDGALRQESSYYCPEFGVKEPNIALAFTMEGKESEASFDVLPN
jgi:uncharacterized heparinase superfamily protein